MMPVERHGQLAVLQYPQYHHKDFCRGLLQKSSTRQSGFDTGFFARGGNRIFEEILDIFGEQNSRIQL